MNLNDNKWMVLLKILSNFKLPEVKNYDLNYVPPSSEEVKEFMKNSVPNQSQFWFNRKIQVQIEGSKYFEELKAVARRTSTYFGIYNTNLTSHEFCEIVAAAKSCTYLYFWFDSISLDLEIDFGVEMKECKIEQIFFNNSGGSGYSNWDQNPMRFENLISAIANCDILSKNLKVLGISNCDIMKEKAQEILNKYKLYKIELSGV